MLGVVTVCFACSSEAAVCQLNSKNWVPQEIRRSSGNNRIEEYGKFMKLSSYTDVVGAFNETQNTLPWDMLRLENVSFL